MRAAWLAVGGWTSDSWRRARRVDVSAVLAGGVPRARRRRRWLVVCASAQAMSGGVRVGAALAGGVRLCASAVP
ncbi:hypothetical protein GUJ93_ZPchr0009g85 [Zizania palustris]|uniref:Uncharacterized protein n=1 Tax=Zizania palustris TaxID=103762 RepID=A0A8J5UXT1_ZIZPA|nr:hypothetical protein GUJ93_ZPchr0009g85 [Zizania palustris]